MLNFRNQHLTFLQQSEIAVQCDCSADLAAHWYQRTWFSLLFLLAIDYCPTHLQMCNLSLPNQTYYTGFYWTVLGCLYLPMLSTSFLLSQWLLKPTLFTSPGMGTGTLRWVVTAFQLSSWESGISKHFLKIARGFCFVLFSYGKLTNTLTTLTALLKISPSASAHWQLTMLSLTVKQKFVEAKCLLLIATYSNSEKKKKTHLSNLPCHNREPGSH